MAVFNFSVCDRKYHFLVNLVQKIKTVSLSQNLVPTLIRICIIQLWWLSFLFSNRNILFKGKFVWKIKVLFWSWNLESMPIQIYKIRWWFSFFFFTFLDWKYPLWVNLIQKFKIISLTWNLVPRLFQICKVRCWCFRPTFFSGVVQKIHLAFWCYLINLPEELVVFLVLVWKRTIFWIRGTKISLILQALYLYLH